MQAAQGGNEPSGAAAQEETRPSVLLVGNPSLPLKVRHHAISPLTLSVDERLAEEAEVS